MTDATDEFITSETCSLAGTKREKTYRRARPKSSAERLEGTVFFGVFFFFFNSLQWGTQEADVHWKRYADGMCAVGSVY